MPLAKPTSKPDWTESNPSFATVTIEPTAGKKITGWTADERPPYQTVNWLFYIVDQWIKYLESITDYKYKTVLVRSTAGAYAVLDTDQVILADLTTGAQTHTLPTAVGKAGMTVTFKKIDASSNILTIEGDGTETIDQELNQTIEDRNTSITMVSDNANWHLI